MAEGQVPQGGPTVHRVEITEEDRRAVVHGLARLAAERPDWAGVLAGVAEKFGGGEEYEALRVEPGPRPVVQVWRQGAERD